MAEEVSPVDPMKKSETPVFYVESDDRPSDDGLSPSCQTDTLVGEDQDKKICSTSRNEGSEDEDEEEKIDCANSKLRHCATAQKRSRFTVESVPSTADIRKKARLPKRVVIISQDGELALPSQPSLQKSTNAHTANELPSVEKVSENTFYLFHVPPPSID
ncbi:unnamed protein product [Soboliphyme baturini]|uniref:Uncharacterized protein n=1 Tax=Soboliphyme baturini TaxID=241478 RepID=A0A183ILQ3_9BILA|nr:unnamed protein product [Soboliphyme baturini]